MPNVIKPLAAGVAALSLAACSGDANPDQNVIITNTIPEGAEIEAVPPSDTVDPPPADNAADPRSPEERGDGDDMVNIIDDTGNRS